MQSRDQIEKLLIEKALKEPEFRRSLLTYPIETIEQEMGITFPAGMWIEVLEEDAHTFYLVLPPAENPPAIQDLSEAELMQVSGGGAYTVYDKTGCESCAECMTGQVNTGSQCCYL